jgi:hypothetical protein
MRQILTDKSVLGSAVLKFCSAGADSGVRQGGAEPLLQSAGAGSNSMTIAAKSSTRRAFAGPLQKASAMFLIYIKRLSYGRSKICCRCPVAEPASAAYGIPLKEAEK